MNVKRFVICLLILLSIYFLLYKIYIPRVSAFGCFDDCFSFAAGYFINDDKVLYSDIFYNHQILPAYISAIVQSIQNPENIFDLVLKHRQFVMFFGFLFNFLLIFRFGLPAFLFFIFFEFSKFYIFGDRFLGETILVYPLVYLIFVSWQKIQKKKINDFDLFFSSISAWLVIFLRETFTPLALVLFLFILFPIKEKPKIKISALILFGVLTALSLLTVNFRDYYFNLLEVNKVFFAQDSSIIIKILFYPIYILISDELNHFKILLTGVDLLFLFSLFYLVVLKKKVKFLFVFIPLIFSNIRVVEPGRVFYDSFHMVPFYGIFLSLTFLLFNELRRFNKKIWIYSSAFLIVIFVYYIFSPQVFFREKINQHGEFITNYGNILQVGSVINNLSTPNDTLFVDGYDEAVYWIAQRQSSYKYSMYTSFMPNFKIYSNARLEMFGKNPPAFYYGSCPKEKNAQRLMPREFMSQYIRLNSYGKPSCILVKKDRIKSITESQWKKAKEFGYELPIDNEKKL